VPFQHDGVAVVEQAVKYGGGDGGVAVEDGGPLLEGFVGGQDDGATFVAGADDLEEQVGSALVDRQVADFVEDEQRGVGVFSQLGFEGALGLGGLQGVDDVDGVGEEYAHALLTSGVAKRGGEVGFAQTDGAEQDEVGMIFNELEAEEVLDLEAVDLFGPVPAEGVEGFDDGEAGALDASGDGAIGPLRGFPFDEPGEVVEVAEGAFGGGGGKRLAVLFEVGQAQGGEVDGEGGGIGFHVVGCGSVSFFVRGCRRG